MTMQDLNRLAQDYVAAFARDGPRSYIANLDTSVRLHNWGDHRVPMTVNHGERGGTFVCSPRVGYIDYPKEELAHFPNRAIVPALRTVIAGVGAVLGPSDVDRIVHINNWMMSTNLPRALDPALASRQTRLLADAYPDHLLAMRSLTWRYNADLIRALEAAGWILLPARQVYLVDDVERDSWPRRDVKRDEALWQSTEYTYEELGEIGEADAQRIARLYAMLYLQKYSTLNPAYTARFVMMTQRIGIIRYLVLRDAAGIIQAFGGMHWQGGHAAMPLLGYDTGVEQSRGLYRLAFHAGSRFAAERGARFNMSSGATAFKRNRGSYAEMEFTVFFIGHLPMKRRLPFSILRHVADRIGVPMLRKYNL